MCAGLALWWRSDPGWMSAWYLLRAQRLEAKADWWRARAPPSAQTLRMSGWYVRRAQRLQRKADWWRARAGPTTGKP
nr:hypothetical protein [uncultured Rhodopila sp.]